MFHPIGESSVVCRSKLLGELGFFMIRSVLMDYALGSTLIDRLGGVQVCLLNRFLITGRNGLVKTAKGSFQSGFIHAIAKVLVLRNSGTLDCGFDVCQSISPPVRFVRTTLRTQDSVPYAITNCKSYFPKTAVFFKKIA